MFNFIHSQLKFSQSNGYYARQHDSKAILIAPNEKKFKEEFLFNIFQIKVALQIILPKF